MAVRIRLARGGRKNLPSYFVVAADARAPRDGKFCDKLGNYNPLLPKNSPFYFTIDKEKLDFWISVGAKPTTVVERLLKKRAAI